MTEQDYTELLDRVRPKATTAKQLSYEELDALPRGGLWIECSDFLPPYGIGVIVETSRGQVKALALFSRYDGAHPNEGWWDNEYVSGNEHVFSHIVRWQPMPWPKRP